MKKLFHYLLGKELNKILFFKNILIWNVFQNFFIKFQKIFFDFFLKKKKKKIL